jgi:exosome complex RNA-binding protein Rrp42 (RNase PH superfamily)
MVVVVDATSQEEMIREEVVVTVNRHGEVCQIAKLGA